MTKIAHPFSGPDEKKLLENSLWTFPAQNDEQYVFIRSRLRMLSQKVAFHINIFFCSRVAF